MRLWIIGLLLIGANAAHAQTVASCPSATIGTVWAKGAWLPCATATAYLAQPLPLTAIMSDMRCPVGGVCAFKWTNQAGMLPTDQVWAKTAAFPSGTWVKASTLTFASPPIPPTPPPYTAPATLTWTAPTTNTDNSVLTNLVGFTIYSGPSASTLVKLATVGPTVLTYSTPIGVGTTFFAVTATADMPPHESALSTVVSRSLAAPTTLVPNPPVLSP
jgi:hypothetical protein